MEEFDQTSQCQTGFELSEMEQSRVTGHRVSLVKSAAFGLSMKIRMNNFHRAVLYALVHLLACIMVW